MIKLDFVAYLLNDISSLLMKLLLWKPALRHAQNRTYFLNSSIQYLLRRQPLPLLFVELWHHLCQYWNLSNLVALKLLRFSSNDIYCFEVRKLPQYFPFISWNYCIYDVVNIRVVSGNIWSFSILDLVHTGKAWTF